MRLYEWEKGLKAHYFSDTNDKTPVRLFVADGQVLYDVYQKIKGNDDPVLDKESAAQDFFREVISSIFLAEVHGRPMFTRPIRITQVAEELSRHAVVRDGKYYADWRVLPLCVFFVAVWSYEFGDELAGRWNDGDYRQRRFPAAVQWGLQELGDSDLEFDRSPQFFSNGIVQCFEMLKLWFGDRVYVCPENLTYGGSVADGITISHSVFRYGEIAYLYTIFAEQGLSPNRIYQPELFERIAGWCFDEGWLSSRNISRKELTHAIEYLYRAWDGEARKRYRHFVGSATDVVQLPPANQIACAAKLYWAVAYDNIAGWPVPSLTIVVDKVANIDTDIHVSSGNQEVVLRQQNLNGLSMYAWKEADYAGGLQGWRALKTDAPIVVRVNGMEKSRVPAFNYCFDGHSVMLMQSYTPPAGGNPIWRLMTGRQGVELWGGDDRPAHPEYALLSPRRFEAGEVICDGITIDCNAYEQLTIGEHGYFIYKIQGNATGALKIGGCVLFDFGLPHEKINAEDYFVAENPNVLYCESDNFIMPCQTTILYLANEKRLAVYYKPANGGLGDHSPHLYAISALDVESYEIEPLSQHRIELDFDGSRRLWISDEIEPCDRPIAVGLWHADLNSIVFSVVDPRGGDDYHESWKGYFLPRLNVDADLVIMGSMLTRGFIPMLHDILGTVTTMDGVVCRLEDVINRINELHVLEDCEKLRFIHSIAQPLTTRLIDGLAMNPDFPCLKNSFVTTPDAVRSFYNKINNGRFKSLGEYFALALMYLAVMKSEIISDSMKLRRLRMVLRDFRPNPEIRIVHYSAQFICEAIVHVVLEGLPDDVMSETLKECVKVVDGVVRQMH